MRWFSVEFKIRLIFWWQLTDVRMIDFPFQENASDSSIKLTYYGIKEKNLGVSWRSNITDASFFASSLHTFQDRASCIFDWDATKVCWDILPPTVRRVVKSLNMLAALTTVSLLLIPRVFLTIMVHDKFSGPGPDCHDSEHYKVHKSHRQLYSDTSQNIRSQIIHFLG